MAVRLCFFWCWCSAIFQDFTIRALEAVVETAGVAGLGCKNPACGCACHYCSDECRYALDEGIAVLGTCLSPGVPRFGIAAYLPERSAAAATSQLDRRALLAAARIGDRTPPALMDTADDAIGTALLRTRGVG